MTSLAALAEIPGRIENLFLNRNNEVSPNGIYGVNLYTLGVPHTVIVDDYLPLEENYERDGYKTLFAKVGDDGSIWGPIVEKAFAKYHGNYKHISGGDPAFAVRTLFGAPFKNYMHEDIYDREAFW